MLHFHSILCQADQLLFNCQAHLHTQSICFCKVTLVSYIMFARGLLCHCWPSLTVVHLRMSVTFPNSSMHDTACLLQLACHPVKTVLLRMSQVEEDRLHRPQGQPPCSRCCSPVSSCGLSSGPSCLQTRTTSGAGCSPPFLSWRRGR